MSAILAAIDHKVGTKFFDPSWKGVNWNEILEARRNRILQSRDRSEFEAQVNEVLRQLQVSHVGLYHESVRRATSKMALSATFFQYREGKEQYWMFQDVHEGGPAQAAGLEPGDILLSVDERDVSTSEAPMFPMGATVSLRVRKRNRQEQSVRIRVPDPKSKKQPVILPKLVSAKRLEGGIGWLKVSMFPGIVGIEVAQMISQAVDDLDCDRLIIDLRGNTGGGMGCLRLMSLLTPGKLPVGYSVTRKRASVGVDPDRLMRFDHIPTKKVGLVPLLARFAFGDKSIAVFTEGLPKQRFAGRIVLLVNEHTASASEMVTAFAAEHQLATIVGTKTAGRVVGAQSFKVGEGYRVMLPVVTYKTWNGTILEGNGIEPTVSSPFVPFAEVDQPLQSAIEVLQADVCSSSRNTTAY